MATIENNPPGFYKALLDNLNAELLAEAEPFIEEATRELERRLRTKLAQRLVGLLQSNVQLSRNGTELVITIRQVFEDRPL